MKLKTHNLFGFAIALRISVDVLGLEILYAVLLSLYLSLAINWATDFLVGHRGGRRTPYTHSLLGSAIISIAIALLIPILGRALHLNIEARLLTGLILVAISVGLSHLLLDMLTADGVYLLWPMKRFRTSILGARYDDPILNLVAIAISIIIISSVVIDKIMVGLRIPQLAPTKLCSYTLSILAA